MVLATFEYLSACFLIQSDSPGVKFGNCLDFTADIWKFIEMAPGSVDEAL